MSLAGWRNSKVFRIISLFLLLDFLTFQNLYGQEFHVQEGTSIYTPVLEIEANLSHFGPPHEPSGSRGGPFSRFLRQISLTSVPYRLILRNIQ